DDEIIGVAVALLMACNERLAKGGESSFVFSINDELVWISAPIRSNGHGFTAIDQLGAAFAETLPTPGDVGRDAACCGAVPAFHRLDSETVADLFAVDLDIGDFLRQRGVAASGDRVLAGDFDSKWSNVVSEIRDGFERRDADEFDGVGHVSVLGIDGAPGDSRRTVSRERAWKSQHQIC